VHAAMLRDASLRDAPQHEVAYYAATLIVPAPLSTITGECRYSIEGGVPYLPVTNSFHSAV